MSNPIRVWDSSEGPCPFKRNQGVGMRTIHGFDEPFRIRPDQMHVYAYGYGKDFAASSVILCARMKVWPGRGLDARLEIGFQKFRSWCQRNKKSTSLHEFSRKIFKMGQFLGLFWKGFKLGCCTENPTISKFTIPILNPSQVLEQVSYWLWQSLRCHLGGPVAGGGTTGC